MTHTLIAFHAHPDDEALLTAGTMARAAAEGHRVVLVVATDGDLGLAASTYAGDGHLGERRLAELRASADHLGVARVEHLGYADSGLGPGSTPTHPGAPGSRGPPTTRLPGGWRRSCARRADVLLTYDRNGGYGHPDHVKVHRVGHSPRSSAHASRAAGHRAPGHHLSGDRPGREGLPLSAGVRPDVLRARVQPAVGDHRIGVRRYAGAKRARCGPMPRRRVPTAGRIGPAAFLRIPRPVYDLVFGREWFIDPTRRPGSPSSGTSSRA